MTDLAKGVIDLGEVAVTKDTTREELLRAYGDGSPDSGVRLLDFPRLFNVDGTEFGIHFFFADNEVLKYVEMTPYITYKSEKWDREGKQAERRIFCDQWLALRLGDPQEKNKEVTAYNFKTCRVSAFSSFPFGKEEGYDAGCIFVRFSR